MPEQDQPRLQLSIVQVMAGALASVSAAVVASTLGVAGTLLGAAVMSIVATIGSALYTHSLEQAHTRIRIRRNPRTGRTEQVVPPVPAPHRFAWGRVMGMAVLVFAFALGTITAMEAVVDQPLASLVKGTPAGQPRATVPVRSSTSVGTVWRNVPAVAPAAATPTPTAPRQAPASRATTDDELAPTPTTAPRPRAPTADELAPTRPVPTEAALPPAPTAGESERDSPPAEQP